MQALVDLLTKVVAQPELPFYICMSKELRSIWYSPIFCCFFEEFLRVDSSLPNIADTAPPKKQIKDLTQDFYSAGFVPGAIVYFSYDQPEGLEYKIHPAYLKFLWLD